MSRNYELLFQHLDEAITKDDNARVEPEEQEEAEEIRRIREIVMEVSESECVYLSTTTT